MKSQDGKMILRKWEYYPGADMARRQGGNSLWFFMFVCAIKESLKELRVKRIDLTKLTGR